MWVDPCSSAVRMDMAECIVIAKAVGLDRVELLCRALR
jgi:hypothetical protein